MIEILVVIGVVALLAAIVIVAINPARQFAQARNSQRQSNVTAILNTVGQNMVENKGVFTCASGVLPSTATNISSISGDYNLRACVVPTYIPELPVDPMNGITWTGSSYDTKYTVMQDSVARVTVCAPGGVEAAIVGSTPICMTR